MKKRNIILCSMSIVIIGFIMIVTFENKNKTFIEHGVTYALMVDGVRQNSFPSKGTYQVDVKCENATCKWDYDAWKLFLENITGNVSCNITFTTISKNYLNDYIIGLVGTTQGEGSIVQEKGYRYEGQDPNNYVWFNNEPWRIIGVMDAESHGQTGLSLVKIVKNETIGTLVWDNLDVNDWNASKLKALLNTEYLNSQNGTNGNNCHGYESVKAKCDYTTIGIKDTYRKMIKEVTWYLGGWNTYSVTAEEMYGYERGTSVYTDRPTSGTGKIGLIYVSDYGYSVLATNCARTKDLNLYDANCAINNWMHGKGSVWTITPNSSSPSGEFLVNYQGKINDNGTSISYGISPSLYLDSSVYVLDGTGSKIDPYIIGM